MDKDNFISIFYQRLSELLKTFQSRDKSISENDFFKNHRVSDSEEENFVTQELCEYIDTFYEKRKEYENSGMDAGLWFENEIDKTISELYPDATETERNDFKEAVAEGIDKQNSDLADALKISMSGISDMTKQKGGEQ